MRNRSNPAAAAGLALLAALLFAGIALEAACARKPSAGASTASAQKWTCAMHPEVVSDKPGKCPICGMDLIPKGSPAVASSPQSGVAGPDRRVLYWYDPMKPEVHFDKPGKSPFMDMQLQPRYAEESPVRGEALPPGFSRVRIPLERRQEIGVTTAKVARRAVGGAVTTNGVVAEDEGRVHSVNAKFSGYIEKLYVDRTGQPVRRGEPLLSVYSPDLVATEREYLLALENARRLSGSSSAGAASDAAALVSASRERLRLWDIPDSEIARIEKSGQVSRDLTLVSPASGVVLKKEALPGAAITAGMPLYTIADLSTVWVLADVYQSEMAMVSPGVRADVAATFLPGETFTGKVDFVYPTLTEESRTVKARIVLGNPKGSLKPGMFVRVSLAGNGREAVAVPNSALIQTGERQVAFVEESPGAYAPREVRTGIQGKDFAEVLSGLSEGEIVVTSGNFLIDSESRIGAIGAAPQGSAGQPAQSLGSPAPTPGGPPR
ncbi:MAG TPA: efflux RND transporter periplasmic adaptor subunit [Thermoanaerobaculia bacterium]|nr:efflux RND transporter periplasmic adaptor subunit [Thermoanaerobaculia bacterium]